MKIESRIGKSASTDKQVYDFITDFNNFRDLLPEGRVTGWESSGDRCSFHVDPVGREADYTKLPRKFSLTKLLKRFTIR